MSQSRRMSLVEAITSTCVGYALAVIVQVVAFPIFGFDIRLVDNLLLGAIFTAVSLTRSYALRRLFERRLTPPARSASEYRHSECD